MKRALAFAAVLLALAPAGCRNPTSPEDGLDARGAAPVRGGPAPVVTGTVIDARTGKPVPGALVRGPGGSEAKCDARGRFVLRGLRLGASGELVATSASLTGKNRLRPLESGPLEVVLHVR